MGAVAERAYVATRGAQESEAPETIEAVAERLARNAERAARTAPHLSLSMLLHLIHQAYIGSPERKVKL
jgi:hypothetical protein